MRKLDKIKIALAKLITNFSTQKTDKGVIGYETGEDLKEGDAVYIVGEEGEELPIEDGDYITEDGIIISVANGKVSAIKEKEEPQEDETPVEDEKPTEEMEDEKQDEEEPKEDETPVEEEKPTEGSEMEDVGKLREELTTLYGVVDELVKVVEDLQNKINEISVAKPAEEEFEQVKKPAKDKRSERLNSMFK